MSSVEKVPKTWPLSASSAPLPALPLMAFNESTTALIDSSTPYLWLPTAVCDRFAQALNLTWNETLGLYLFPSNVPYDGISMADLSFTFTLSSLDNRDNFGQPLNVSRIVNITTSADAFSQTLRYPFMDVFNYGDAAIPYFPLKRVESGNRIILGRSFMQEAYLLTNYEKSSFSVHQASFPADPQRNISIVTIEHSPNSPYAGNPKSTTPENADPHQGLTKPQIVGVALGALAIGMSMIVLLWCTRRQIAPTGPAPGKEDEWSYEDSLAEKTRPRSPISRFLSKIVKAFPGTTAQPTAFEVDGTSRSIEAPANERRLTVHYEMASDTRQPPVELEAMDTYGDDDATHEGTEDSGTISAYEAARRKMHRQLQGPVPAYSGPSPAFTASHYDEPGKSEQDVSPMAHYRPSEQTTTTAYSAPLPSPTSPTGDWQAPSDADLPSPMTSAHSPSVFGFSQGNSGPVPEWAYSPNVYSQPTNSGTSSPVDTSTIPSPTLQLPPPQPAIQRTPIDPSSIVCLGPLPNNVKLPPVNKPPMRLPRLVGPDGQDIALDSRDDDSVKSSADTLGSNFTLEQQENSATARSQVVSMPQPVIHAASRIDGDDLVHVPQPAPTRYSWEQDR
jgi:hypothetical protein